MPRYSVKDILRVTKGKLLAGFTGIFLDPARMSTDTRAIRRGDIFLALSGANFDGNDFAGEAFRNGASGAIVSRDIIVPAGKFAIRVGDTTAALQSIAAFHRSKFRIPLIAVTGSNGKTTVKDMIWTVLSKKYNVLRNEGTKNNHIGVPQTLLKLTSGHDMCILELGTNHKGEIRTLGNIVRPTMVVMTNIGPSHLEFLGDLEGVFKEKREALSTFSDRAKRVVILNGDDPYLSRIRSRSLVVIRAGLGKGNDLRGAVMGRDRSSVRFITDGKEEYVINLLGDHNVYNSLIAIAVGRYFKVSCRSIRRSLGAFRPTAMRLDLKEMRGFSVIDDSYNSNPLSMQRALEAIGAFPAGSKWIVSGDMLELGPGSVDFHKEIGEMVAGSRASGLVTIGELSRHTIERARAKGMDDTRLWHCTTHDEIAAVLRRVVKRGDVVLLKGSRSMKMERVLEKL